MRRREFISVIGGAAAWPLVSWAQQGKRIRRIGVLLFGTPDNDPDLGAFLRGLRELGYVHGQNIATEYRYAEGKPVSRSRQFDGREIEIIDGLPDWSSRISIEAAGTGTGKPRRSPW